MNGKRKPLFIIILSYLASSSATIVAPFADGDRNLMIASGVVFWIFFLFGTAVFLLLPKPRKDRANRERSKLPSILRFFQSNPAIFADLAFFISVIVNIAVILYPVSNKIHGALIFLLIFSFEMHCVFNSDRYLNKNKKYVPCHIKNQEGVSNV